MWSERKSARAHSPSRPTRSISRSRDLRTDERVVRDDDHVERASSPGNFLPNAAKAGQTERLAANFFAEKALLVPLALLHRGIRSRHLSGKCQHERYRKLRDADA